MASRNPITTVEEVERRFESLADKLSQFDEIFVLLRGSADRAGEIMRGLDKTSSSAKSHQEMVSKLREESEGVLRDVQDLQQRTRQVLNDYTQEVSAWQEKVERKLAAREEEQQADLRTHKDGLRQEILEEQKRLSEVWLSFEKKQRESQVSFEKEQREKISEVHEAYKVFDMRLGGYAQKLRAAEEALKTSEQERTELRRRSDELEKQFANLDRETKGIRDSRVLRWVLGLGKPSESQ